MFLHNWLESVLDEQYRFVKCLHKTEKSEIIVLEHKTLNKRIVKRVFTGQSEVYEKLLTLKHKNTPEILEVTELEDKVLVLEEYIDGFTLSELLSENLYKENQVKKLVSELCDVLTFLHSHDIIHRDIKPENIMIENNTQTLKLLDFDSARIYKKYCPRDTEHLGTVGYAAPEQYGGVSDIRTDIKQVGELMEVMLTGETSDKISYNGELSDIIAKCIHISPDKRFQSAEELKSALTEKKKSKLFSISLSIILLAVIGCIIFALLQNSTTPQNSSQQNNSIITTTATSQIQTTVQTSESTQFTTITTTDISESTTTNGETTTTTENSSDMQKLLTGDYMTEGKSISQIQGYGGYEDVGGTILEIEEISENAITFSIIKYSESGLPTDTISARNIIAEIIDNKADFKFTDMLDGHGTGAMTFENGKIYIKTWSDDNSTSIIVDEYLIFNDIV